MGSEDEIEVVEKYRMEGMMCLELELVLRYKQTSRQLPGAGSSAKSQFALKECTSVFRNIFQCEDVVDINSSRDQLHFLRFCKIEHQDY
jgi:hypothetical protein